MEILQLTKYLDRLPKGCRAAAPASPSAAPSCNPKVFCSTSRCRP
jgi:hypothetical protein